jgi:poly-gamma-glutamate synthesis protein (capsule biosynthesis protein)
VRQGRALVVVVAVLVCAAPAHGHGDTRPPSLQWRLQEFAGGWWVKIHLSERATVTVRLSREGAPERRVRARSVPAGTARLALGRLRGGRYRVRIVARDPSGRRAVVAHAIRLPRLVTIAVSGDLLIHTPVAARALVNGGGRRYRFGPMLARISPLIRRADLALCHLEHPIGRGPPTGYPRFRAPAALAGAIRAAGYDVCSTASNHTLDYGQSGIDATLRSLDRAGVRHTGSGSRPPADRPALLSTCGVTVGFVAATESTNGIARPFPWSVALADPGAILAAARRARRAGAQAVIVNLHWGAEYRHAPTPSQWKLARLLTASPAVTAVVGQHAHVVQPIRFLNGKPVVFGEGNLLSNQSGASEDGLIALLDLAVGPLRARTLRVRYLPTHVRRPDYAVVPARGNSRRRTIVVAGRTARVLPITSLDGRV